MQRKEEAKEELVGHSALVVMALLGMAVYSASYSLLYSATATKAVATVEMWMTTTHLVSSVACCAAQSMAMSVWDAPLGHVAKAQTAVFLGVALAVTLLANDCITTEQACPAYFGAAVVPKFAAAGAAVWSWIMYASSLGCQSNGVSLGFLGDKIPLTAAAAMALVPHAILHKLSTTCPGAGTFDSAPLLGVCATLLAIGLCLAWTAQSPAIRILGAGFVFIEPYIAWAIMAGNKVQPIYYVVNSALGLLALLREVINKKRRAAELRGRNKSA